MHIGGRPLPLSPPADEPDGSPQSPFSRHGKFQSSVRAELTSYQFKVTSHSFCCYSYCHYDATIVIFRHSSTQDEKQRSCTVRYIDYACAIYQPLFDVHLFYSNIWKVD